MRDRLRGFWLFWLGLLLVATVALPFLPAGWGTRNPLGLPGFAYWGVYAILVSAAALVFFDRWRRL
jgi:hypothetical protein